LILAVKNGHTIGLSSQVIVVAAAVSFITACLLGLVSSLEHKRTVRSSTLLAIYLLFTAILDIARVRTQWLASYSAAIAGILTTSLVLKIATLLVEAQSKLSLLRPREKQIGPEELSGFYSKSLFLWLNPLLRLGFSKVFTLNDLYCLDEQLLSASLVKRFEPIWLKCESSIPQNKQFYRKRAC
jgi:ATP-binding cassette, subfamily C (CFTR/MRP), member 1